VDQKPQFLYKLQVQEFKHSSSSMFKIKTIDSRTSLKPLNSSKVNINIKFKFIEDSRTSSKVFESKIKIIKFKSISSSSSPQNQVQVQQRFKNKSRSPWIHDQEQIQDSRSSSGPFKFISEKTNQRNNRYCNTHILKSINTIVALFFGLDYYFIDANFTI